MTPLIASRYEPLRPLGTGASSTVWLVRDTFRDGRRLALKRLASGGRGAALSDEFRRLSSFDCPAIPRADAIGVDPATSTWFVTTEPVEGQPMLEALAAMPLDDQLDAIAELLRTLRLVHDRGVVHRDLKPEHVVIPDGAAHGRLHLLDFGLATLDPKAGEVAGSLPYLAPELFLGEPASPASDLYSLGIMLYELWFGRRPIEAETPAEYAEAHATQSLVIADDHLPIPPSLVRILQRLLAKSVDARYPNASSVLRDLSRISLESLPLESAPSMRGRLRTPPFTWWTAAPTDRATPVRWVVGPTREAGERLARLERAWWIERGAVAVDVPLAHPDAEALVARQIAALAGDTEPGPIATWGQVLVECNAVLCVDLTSEPGPDAERWLRRLVPHALPWLITARVPPEESGVAGWLSKAGRTLESVVEARITLSRCRDDFRAWMGVEFPDALAFLFDDPAGLEVSRLCETMSLWFERGGLEVEEGRMRVHRDRCSLDGAGDLLAIAVRRFEALTERQRRLVQALAVHGHEVIRSALPSLLGEDVEDQTLAALFETRWLEAAETERGPSVHLASKALREAALSDVEPDDRSRLHARAVPLVESERPSVERDERLAEHRLRASPDDGAIDFVIEVTHRALRLGRASWALDLAREASTVTSDETARRRLMAVIGSAQLHLGSAAEAIATFEEALALEGSETDGELRLEMARAFERAGRFHDGLAVLEPVAGEGALEASAAAQQAFLWYRLGEDERASEMCGIAASQLPAGAGRERVRVHNTYGLILSRMGEDARAVEQFSRAIDLAVEADHPLWQASAQHNLGRHEDAWGRLASALSLFAAGREAMVEQGDRPMAAVFSSTMAQTLLDLGRVDEANQCLRASREEVEATKLGAQYQRPLATLQALGAVAEGEFEAALDSIARCRALGAGGDSRAVWIADLLELHVRTRQGDVDAGHASLERVRAARAEGLERDAVDMMLAVEWSFLAWAGDDETLAAALEEPWNPPPQRKARADLVESRARALIRLERWNEVSDLLREERSPLDATDLDDRRAVALAMEAVAAGATGRRVDDEDVRRAVDVLLAPGHRARRAEALWLLGRARRDHVMLDEARRLAESVRFNPLAAASSDAANALGDPVNHADDDALRRRLRSLEQLKEVTKTITRELEGERLLRMVLDHALEHTGAQRGFLILMKGGAMSIEVARNIEPASLGADARGTLSPEDIEHPECSVSSSVALQVARDGVAVLSSDAGTDERFTGASSISQLRLRSILCVPLQGHGPLRGAIYLDDPTRMDRFGEPELRYLEDLSDHASIALEKASLLRENLDRQRLLEQSKQEIERLNQQLERTVAAQAQELIEVKESLRATRAELSLKYDYPSVVTRSKRMEEVLRWVDKITDSQYPVYLFGESGTGKELIARCLHVNGPRSSLPYFSVNCASFSPTLVETELFGHVRGAFTGADRDKPGVFELAHEGILFLDEVSDAPMELQAKLLRAVQFGEVLRVGSDEVRRVDVRVVSASNRDLAVEVQEGRFREDLYYRLNVHRVELPPLRDRREDVPLLVDHFQRKHADNLGGEPLRYQRGALTKLSAYEWPGNIRELENLVIDLLVRCADEGEVREDRLPDKVRTGVPKPTDGVLPEGKGLKSLCEEYERSLIESVLRRCNGVRARAARELQMSERNLYKKLSKYGLDTPS